MPSGPSGEPCVDTLQPCYGVHGRDSAWRASLSHITAALRWTGPPRRPLALRFEVVYSNCGVSRVSIQRIPDIHRHLDNHHHDHVVSLGQSRCGAAWRAHVAPGTKKITGHNRVAADSKRQPWRHHHITCGVCHAMSSSNETARIGSLQWSGGRLGERRHGGSAPSEKQTQKQCRCRNAPTSWARHSR